MDALPMHMFVSLDPYTSTGRHSRYQVAESAAETACSNGFRFLGR